MTAPARRGGILDAAAPPPASLRASPGIRRVMVNNLTADRAKGRLCLNADLLVRESISSGRDELDDVLNYETVVHTLRRASTLESSLSAIAEHACAECFAARDVVEVRIEAAWEPDGSNTAVAYRVRTP